LYFPITIKETCPSVLGLALLAGRECGNITAELFSEILTV
jgi:hypothetical protein